MKQVKIFKGSCIEVLESQINRWFIENHRQEVSIEDRLMCIQDEVIIISIWYNDTDITK